MLKDGWLAVLLALFIVTVFAFQIQRRVTELEHLPVYSVAMSTCTLGSMSSVPELDASLPVSPFNDNV